MGLILVTDSIVSAFRILKTEFVFTGLRSSCLYVHKWSCQLHIPLFASNNSFFECALHSFIKPVATLFIVQVVHFSA
jgi:hypothetical protein